MTSEEAYGLFFNNMADALDTTEVKTANHFESYEAYGEYFKMLSNAPKDEGIRTLAQFDIYKAELMATAQGKDIEAIQSLYTEIKGLRYDADNYVGTLQGNSLEIKDKVTMVVQRYSISNDEVAALAFADVNVTNEAGLDAKLLAHSYDINIRDILNNMSALKVSKDTTIDKAFISEMEAVDLSATRLSVAGVSEETSGKISELKTAFINALNDNEPTREIEYEIGSTAISAQSEMNSKHLKYLCRLQA